MVPRAHYRQSGVVLPPEGVFVRNHHTRQIVPDELDCWRITTTMARRFCLGVNGQSRLINRMLIALLCDGHLLVEGAPGLAKTRAIKVLAESIEGNFHRLQFTPDLLPADLTGTDIYRPQDGTFEFREGPLFHNLILADEINRAPAKVQSALLEAMEERQITVGDSSYKLPKLFMVMATQNPIEQEGTYPLPEAQLDRFLLHAQVGYPTPEDERKILVLNRNEAKSGERDAFAPPELMSEATVMEARQQILNMHLSDELEQYIVNVVVATRNPGTMSGRKISRTWPETCCGTGWC